LEGEITLLKPLVRSGDLIIEVGAKLGAQTVAFAKAVSSKGKVLAIEPQRLLFQMLCGNLAINQCINVYPYPVAVGASSGFTQIPVPPTFRAETELPVSEPVQVTTLDSFAVPQCRLLKINGLETALSILQGATATVQRHQPIVYIRDLQPQSASSAWNIPSDLQPYLEQLGYNLYRHPVPWYQPDNFRLSPLPESNPIASNLLGLPRRLEITVQGVERITPLPRL
ncbi:MAG TPA: FkbM family methyltransferase, partial [Microcoleaceae cyanobacterium]